MVLQTKLCAGCDQQFAGRPNAKVCSSRCRKRIFRAKQAIRHEVDKLSELKAQIKNVLKRPANSWQRDACA